MITNTKVNKSLYVT